MNRYLVGSGISFFVLTILCLAYGWFESSFTAYLLGTLFLVLFGWVVSLIAPKLWKNGVDEDTSRWKWG
ncbi:hypothetical protein [Hazenella coriacea]|uniref:Uncharacterized protein n=1 Tax=Hazenella coriacea TaxID=1179467 RepID=A0A4R3L2M2_9BACL|nr:hypothetical protein [Hazenella coriacea]TCS93145.1 hypothetical protein EDD58_10987 [Hazenella coriacea]